MVFLGSSHVEGSDDDCYAPYYHELIPGVVNLIVEKIRVVVGKDFHGLQMLRKVDEEVGGVVHLWELTVLGYEGESVVYEGVEDADEHADAKVGGYGQEHAAHRNRLHKNISEQGTDSTQLTH